jgi:hypothetical protein
MPLLVQSLAAESIASCDSELPLDIPSSFGRQSTIALSDPSVVLPFDILEWISTSLVK